jgi:S1-C subfamily serine protease
MTGLEDTPRILPISAPVQPGNSGDPLLDERENIVGVVVAQIRPGLAQDVNFAIKASVAGINTAA